jgi:hypothetical protein
VNRESTDTVIIPPLGRKKDKRPYSPPSLLLLHSLLLPSTSKGGGGDIEGGRTVRTNEERRRARDGMINNPEDSPIGTKWCRSVVGDRQNVHYPSPGPSLAQSFDIHPDCPHIRGPFSVPFWVCARALLCACRITASGPLHKDTLPPRYQIIILPQYADRRQSELHVIVVRSSPTSEQSDDVPPSIVVVVVVVVIDVRRFKGGGASVRQPSSPTTR